MSRKKTASKVRARASKKASARKATSKSRSANVVSRARAAKPSRSTSSLAAAAKRMGSIVRSRPKTKPVPSPLPTKHVAPPRPMVVAPARSMPPLHQAIAVAQVGRTPLAITEFAEAGVLLSITYSIRDGRRGEFFDLMKDLKPLLNAIGGADCSIYEDRSRPNYFMEVFRFKDEAEFTAFDDKFHKDRKIAAIYTLLDDIVESEKSDFKIFERKL